jgi:hypothetical protein
MRNQKISLDKWSPRKRPRLPLFSPRYPQTRKANQSGQQSKHLKPTANKHKSMLHSLPINKDALDNTILKASSLCVSSCFRPAVNHRGGYEKVFILFVMRFHLYW